MLREFSKKWNNKAFNRMVVLWDEAQTFGVTTSVAQTQLRNKISDYQAQRKESLVAQLHAMVIIKKLEMLDNFLTFKLKYYFAGTKVKINLCYAQKCVSNTMIKMC